jgi:hypothetical protein
MVGYVAQTGEIRNAYTIIVRKPEGKRPFGRPRHRMELNIKQYLQEHGIRVWNEFIWLRTGGFCKRFL